MAEPKGKSMEEFQRRILNECLILMVVSIVHILLWGWLTSINAVAWLRPFLLEGSILFAILAIKHTVINDILRYRSRQ
jgi:uncharacterized integral membrane protein